MQIQDELQGMPLPPIYKRNGADCFLDPYREKIIPVTSEEYVRVFVPNRVIIKQHLSHYGIQRKDRADIVIHRDTEEGMTCFTHPVQWPDIAYWHCCQRFYARAQ